MRFLMIKIPTVFFLFSFVVLCTQSMATELRFEKFDVDNGLSHEIVRRSVQDQRGFMWFATEGGLNRFDGFDFNLVPIDVNGQSVTSVINDMLIDAEGIIWLATLGDGVIRFDPDSHLSQRIGAASLPSPTIKKVFIDSQSRLWVGTSENGLSMVSLKEDYQVTNYSGDVRGVSHPSVTAFAEDNLGRIWIGTDGGGLDVLTPESSKWLNFNAQDNQSINDNRITSMLKDSKGDIWIGTETAGVNRYSMRSKKFSYHRYIEGDPSSLSNDFVLSIYEDRQQRIWVGTDNGISLLVGDNFQQILGDKSEPDSLSNNRIFNIFQDAGNIIWIGTYSGLNKWNPAKSAFDHTIPRTVSGLNYGLVTGFAKDSAGTLYVSTYGSGIVTQKAGSSRWQDLTVEGELPDNRIMSIMIDRDDGIWLGTRANGLMYRSADGDAWQQFKKQEGDPNSLLSNGVTNIIQDSKDNIWVASYNGGISRKTDTGFINFRKEVGGFGLTSKNIMQLIEDQEGYIWAAAESGINRIDPRDNSVVQYQFDGNNPEGLSGDLTWQIFEDSRGNLWVATQGNGINVWSYQNRAKNQFKLRKLQQDDGLPSNTIYGFTEDKSGDIWVSSARGISRIDSNSFDVENFDKSHGLQGYDFNLNAAFSDNSGKIYFGGNNGFNQFIEDDLVRQSLPPKVELLAVTGIYDRFEIPSEGPLELGHNDYLVAFDYVALDFAAPEKNQYKYRLSPLDKDWIDVGNLRRATYTNLPPGIYTFSVQGKNISGAISDPQINLQIRVHPAPWATPYAYAFYVLLVALSLFLFLRNQMRKLAAEEKQRKLLEVQVAERTEKLAKQNEELKVLNMELERAHIQDALTGINNRHFLDLYLKDSIPEIDSGNGDSKMLVLLIDMDGLKPVNDNLGHAAGDAVISHMADLFSKQLPEKFHIIRWGGDEFMIVGKVAHQDETLDFVKTLSKAIEKDEFVWFETAVNLSCSMGFAHYPFDDKNASAISWDQVSMLADKALYSAKQDEGVTWFGVTGSKREINELYLSDLMHCQRITQVDDLVHIISRSDFS